MTYWHKNKLKFFKNFSNLPKSLLVKLPDLSNKCSLEFIFLYSSNFTIPEVFHIKDTSEEKVIQIMKYIEISQAAGIDKLPERFL